MERSAYFKISINMLERQEQTRADNCITDAKGFVSLAYTRIFLQIHMNNNYN